MNKEDETRLIEDYFNYNPDADPAGIEGIKIAERVLGHCNYNLKEVEKWALAHGLARIIQVDSTLLAVHL